MKALISFLFLSLISLMSLQAIAQDTGATGCQQPTIPNSQASELVVKSFNRHLDEYKECTKKYIDEQRAIEKKYADQSVAAHNAAEAMVKEFNDYVAKLNSRNEGTKKNDHKDGM